MTYLFLLQAVGVVPPTINGRNPRGLLAGAERVSR